MCIAVYKPEGMLLSDETLKNCWDGNPDGAGFMYPEEGKLHIVKGLMTFAAFKEAYEPHKNKQCALHFRIATHGKTDAQNTHPFRVSDTLGLVHNGIINNIKCDINVDMSDTWHFTEKIMKRFEWFWNDDAFKALVETFIGYSKLILMDGEGNYSIYGEKLGEWDCQCWFSNKSYQTKSYSKQTYSGSHWTRKSWKTGDVASLVWEDKGHTPAGLPVTVPKGTNVKVESFGHGAFVWVVCVDNGFLGVRFKVSAYGLAEIEEDNCVLSIHSSPDLFTVDQEVIFAKNYNHFRVGDKVVVTSVAKDNLLVSELGSKDKNYLVPKANVRPALVLLN